jgi:hypothetical protein
MSQRCQGRSRPAHGLGEDVAQRGAERSGQYECELEQHRARHADSEIGRRDQGRTAR